MRHDPAQEFVTVVVGYHPVEKIAFDCTLDIRRAECLAGQQLFGIVLPHVQNSDSDAFCNDDQKGMLEPERVALHLPAIDEFEKLRPELTLEQRRRIALDLFPKSLQGRLGESVGDGTAAQLLADRRRIRRQ